MARARENRKSFVDDRRRIEKVRSISRLRRIHRIRRPHFRNGLPPRGSKRLRTTVGTRLHGSTSDLLVSSSRIAVSPASNVAPAASDSGVLPIAEPIVVEHAGAVQWSNDCDVLVIGFGAAGASAALEAK